MNRDLLKRTKKYKKKQLARMKYGYLIIFLCALFLPSYVRFESTGINTYRIFLNGSEVGITDSEDTAEECLIDARRKLAGESDELVLADADLTYEGSEEVYCELTSDSDITDAMLNVLENSTRETLARSYTLKIGQYMINLSSTDDILKILQASLDKYQDDDKFEASLELDPDRELCVLTAGVDEKEDTDDTYDFKKDTLAGVYKALDESFDNVQPDEADMDFEDYEQGIMSMSFANEVEVVECYLPQSEITDLDTAIEEVTQDQAKPTVYEVQSGDTLSQIAEKVDIPMDEIVAMNDSLTDSNSMISVGQELTITVPQPILSVDRVEQVYYEEDYEAEVVYIDNDEWYTTEQVTRQEPSAGHHNVMAQITYHNNDEEDVTWLKEEVTYQAVAKIVERGTIVPPSYIKPISGGRMTSTFGYRKRPTAGASSYHKGIDWATPTGTAVMASSGGTVIKAGWGSGYGYCVYIQHPDGKQTRYGHLSKVLVKAGQTVSQGQKIALSGNTGVSTGPHLHFEILVNGAQVNPLNYLN